MRAALGLACAQAATLCTQVPLDAAWVLLDDHHVHHIGINIIVNQRSLFVKLCDSHLLTAAFMLPCFFAQTPLFSVSL